MTPADLRSDVSAAWDAGQPFSVRVTPPALNHLWAARPTPGLARGVATFEAPRRKAVDRMLLRAVEIALSLAVVVLGAPMWATLHPSR